MRAHQVEEDIQADSELEADWRALLALGPRPMGSRAVEETVNFLLYRLGGLDLATSHHNFTYMGWQEQAPPQLVLHTPKADELDVASFLWSGATPEEGIRGHLVYLGQHIIWDLYRWERFALVNRAGEIFAYISGRPDGEAIPQALPGGSGCKPHLALGTENQQKLKTWLQSGIDVEATIISRTILLPDQIGMNLIASLAPQSEASEGRIVICAHYDSMPTTLGAYDNASGTVILLALARHLVRRPPPVPVQLIWFGGEEWNLAGSRAYVRDQRQQMDQIQLVINVDGIGRGDLLEVWVGPEPLEASVRKWLHSFGNDGRIRTLFRLPPPAGSDHTSFYEAGVPVVMFTFNDLEILHSARDVYNPACLRNMSYIVGVLTFIISQVHKLAPLRPVRSDAPFGWQRL